MTTVAVLQGTTMAERAFNIDRNAISLPAATAERKRCGVCWGPVENSVWRDPNDPRGSQPVPVPADNTRMECFTWPACGTALQTLVNSTHVESNSQFPTSVHTLRGSKHGPPALCVTSSRWKLAARSAVVVHLLWFLNRLEPVSLQSPRQRQRDSPGNFGRNNHGIPQKRLQSQLTTGGGMLTPVMLSTVPSFMLYIVAQEIGCQVGCYCSFALVLEQT